MIQYLGHYYHNIHLKGIMYDIQICTQEYRNTKVTSSYLSFTLHFNLLMDCIIL